MQSTEITITIRERSDGDYEYNVYNVIPDELDETQELDGGICTSDLSNAVSMACHLTYKLINTNN